MAFLLYRLEALSVTLLRFLVLSLMMMNFNAYLYVEATT